MSAGATGRDGVTPAMVGLWEEVRVLFPNCSKPAPCSQCTCKGWYEPGFMGLPHSSSCRRERSAQEIRGQSSSEQGRAGYWPDLEKRGGIFRQPEMCIPEIGRRGSEGAHNVSGLVGMKAGSVKGS